MAYTNKVYSFRNFSFWFWILLIYVVAALVWWFISLERQSGEMTALKLAQLKLDDPQYDLLRDEALLFQKRQSAKFIGEGVAFLALILAGAVFVYRSIRKQIEVSALQQNFMMAITHELKTPIFAAQGFVHTLLDNPEEGIEIRTKFLEKAAKSLDGLDVLVKDLLTVSQIETGAIKIDKKSIDLRPIILDIFEQLEAKAKSKKVSLKLTGKEGPLLVKADSQRMEQVLVNLIDNGIKYGNQEGKVNVFTEERKKNLQISVKDNGPGIPAEHLPRLFERFYRVDKSRAKMSGGSGLGLSIVKHIVKAHGSQIAVISKIDKGTSFSFKLEKS